MNAFIQVFPKNAKAIKAGMKLLAITRKQFGWNWECQLVDAGQAIVRRVTRKCLLLFHDDPYVLARVIPSLHFSVIQGEYNNKFDE